MGCMVMAVEQIMIGASLVVQRRDSLVEASFLVVVSVSVLTWYAVVCFKWEIDEIRRNIIQIGLPVSNSISRPQSRRLSRVEQHDRS
mmetsp:Transcript_8454/g.14185  ORF Transcript_8454/g.14185 Transcript_8454/m.14185 type:complete len:87 (+) Transcript_8454:846-1106(+)